MQQQKYYALYGKALKQKEQQANILDKSQKTNLQMMSELNQSQYVKHDIPSLQKQDMQQLNVFSSLQLSLKSAICDIQNQQHSYNSLFQTDFDVTPRLNRLYDDYQMFIASYLQNDTSVAEIRLNQYKKKFGSELQVFADKQVQEKETELLQKTSQLEKNQHYSTQLEVQIELQKDELNNKQEEINSLNIKLYNLTNKPIYNFVKKTQNNQKDYKIIKQNSQIKDEKQIMPQKQVLNQCSALLCEHQRAFLLVKKQLLNEKEINNKLQLNYENQLQEQQQQQQNTINQLKKRLNEYRNIQDSNTVFYQENQIFKTQKEQIEKFEWENKKLSQENSNLHQQIKNITPMNLDEQYKLKQQLKQKQLDLKDCQDQVDLLIEEIQKLTPQ
ncbi:hypothetical protein SS50377_25521 [Spironucleus salmonicida]|uniref:Uncharacterized protein n=1 Tax=Spironucleus salmonicida TaxID=348837 RepID=V6LW80_9EUKA|nr:hypothetical protein SS50377_25521 [Spironucleus salmonicida]|eukprot:EST45069.1 Hypothetical protein SS50377_15089 [Spironucleus salmonicida]